MKQIAISNATYGAIWSLATEADQSEDDILARVLRDAQKHKDGERLHQANLSGILDEIKANGQKPIYDQRFKVSFPAGFRIFRAYKGNEHSAEARGGKWLLDGDQSYNSLNELNVAIGAKSENAWISWFYIDPRTNERRPIDALRDRKVISRRV